MRLELLKIWRSRRPHLTVMALAIFLGLMLFGFYTYAQSKTGGQVEFRYTYENTSFFNGLTFALYAFYFGTLMVLPIFAATEGGAQIAGETGSGTMTLLLTRPRSRARVFFAKLGVAAGLAGLSAGVLLFGGLLLGLFVVGWGDLDLYPGVLQLTDRHQHLPQGVALRRLLLVWPAASLALLAPLSMSFWISTWTRSAVNAVGTSVALYSVLYVIAEVHFFQALRPWLFTSAMAYWRELLREDVDGVRLLDGGLRLLGFSALFIALAWRRFRRREER